MTKPKAQVTGCDLKKRTQFPAGKVNVKSFEKRGYEKKTRRGLRENKPKQTEFHTAARTKGVGKREKLPGAPAH